VSQDNHLASTMTPSIFYQCADLARLWACRALQRSSCGYHWISLTSLHCCIWENVTVRTCGNLVLHQCSRMTFGCQSHKILPAWLCFRTISIQTSDRLPY